MDQIRAVLGEEKLSYTGYSYGTDLGAVYTTMFPQRSDRILLDSNLGPGGLDSDGGRLFGLGMEERFPDFAKFAPANPKYGLGSTPEEVTSNYHALAARLDASPEGGIDGAMFRNGVFGRIYADANFPALAELWHALDKGQKLPDGPPDPPGTENSLASHLYVICGDTSWPKSTATCQRDVAADHERFPLYGASTANIRPCADWPKQAREFHQALRAQGVESQLVTYPEEGHGVRAFPALTDFLTRSLQWFDRHLRGL
ncbi:alpha/beta hydrolase family protein [Amycolatopsis panacis]|uniref:Peptidase S9 prolyl oligopeptidase catalytic domain-containing protein n=1 Tax=Amycolatopsis panacis TaxID=2340917 RepID=A0A419I0L8_9PSEU|nr:prolyl oligopeptidase family serine peptidase [Amycolatopsis panacis]RJQ83061.1 hypothetical protein D5S19_20520 [Amycolatopsis panacis]